MDGIVTGRVGIAGAQQFTVVEHRHLLAGDASLLGIEQISANIVTMIHLVLGPELADHQKADETQDQYHGPRD
ncbi:MAG: hypothetical protein GTO41_09660 [Burkholderiales bacterium]|nr:hypothetical protein [Burkholderiales bacterium]